MMGLDLLVTDLDDDFEAFVISPSYRAPATVKQISNRSLSDKGNRHCETVSRDPGLDSRYLHHRILSCLLCLLRILNACAFVHLYPNLSYSLRE